LVAETIEACLQQASSEERSRDRRGGLIIGCDFRTRYQQIAMANGESEELPGAPGSGVWYLGLDFRLVS